MRIRNLGKTGEILFPYFHTTLYRKAVTCDYTNVMI